MRDEVYKTPSASVNSFAREEAILFPGFIIDEDNLCAFPITKVTAMVSPKALPRPSITPPTTPIFV